MDNLSKALDGDAIQWDLANHDASVDKLRNIAEDMMATEYRGDQNRIHERQNSRQYRTSSRHPNE